MDSIHYGCCDGAQVRSCFELSVYDKGLKKALFLSSTIRRLRDLTEA